MSADGHASVTIVTPCLNRADRIAAAVESVRAQTYHGPIEHLVIDGGSTDGTLDLLNRYPNVTVRSEPDKNLYDAINKGLSLAKGSIIGLLNSDDIYRPDAVAKAVEALENAPAAAMACGGAEIVDDMGSVLRRHDQTENRSLEFHDLLFAVPIINARFFRRSVFDRVRPFDIRYSIIADREFLLRAALADERTTVIDGIVCIYGHHGDSLTIGGQHAWDRFSQENMQMVDDWLARQPPISPAITSELMQFHAHSVLMGVAAAALRGDLSAIATIMRRGKALDPWWSAKAAGLFADWVGKRLRPRKN